MAGVELVDELVSPVGAGVAIVLGVAGGTVLPAEVEVPPLL